MSNPKNPDHWKTEAVRERTRNRELPIGVNKDKWGYRYTSFRPRVDVEPAYYGLRRWCDDPEVNSNWSSVLNTLIPLLLVACQNTTEIAEDGSVSVELNFGRVTIR